MKLLFEDDISKFPYHLLSDVYGTNLIGSKSNSNIVSVLIKGVRKDAIVYVDVTPDNPITVRIYKELVQASKNLSNVYVLPIPCIEYYFAWAFIKNTYTEIDTLLKFGKYKDYPYDHRHRKLITSKGFEHFCKSVVEKNRDCHNTIFTTQPCLCTIPESDCENLTLKVKQRRLIYSLPVFPSFEDIKGTNFNTQFPKALNISIQRYYDCAERFKSFGYIKDYPDLN